MKKKNLEKTEAVAIELSAEEANKMLQDKIAELNAVKSEMVNIKARGLKVYEENQLLQHSPQYAEAAAEMKYRLQVAQKFIDAGLFPKETAQSIYVKIQAGAEMGMAPMESVNSLYFVNGKLEPYGKGMVALLTRQGYRVSYEKETPDQVTAVAEKDGQRYAETAKLTDQILVNTASKKGRGALGISAKNKLRFHAIRMILNFQLPHLIAGAADLFEAVHVEANQDENGNTQIFRNEENEGLKKEIDGCKDLDELNKLFKEHESQTKKSMFLTTQFRNKAAELKKANEDENQ